MTYLSLKAHIENLTISMIQKTVHLLVEETIILRSCDLTPLNYFLWDCL